MSFAAAAAAIAGIVLLGSLPGFAEEKPKTEKPKAEKPKRESFGAVAEAQGPQLGTRLQVTIIIEGYSTPEDRQTLLEAYSSGGQKGLATALTRMKSKGHIAFGDSLGYDLNYIAQEPTQDGRRIRIVTDRAIGIAEGWIMGTSIDYDLSLVELDLSSTKGKSAGTLVLAAKFQMSKEGQLEIVPYELEPWKLIDVMEWK